MESCGKHPHEMGVALCRRCGDAWCSDCLVYAFGPDKPPFCMECAMVAGGVRSASARPALSRKELKARRKQVKAEAKAASRPEAEDEVAAMVEAPAEEPASSPAGSIADWATPWWEDRQPTLAD